MPPEYHTLGDGTLLAIHARNGCRPPCAFHSPLPGPWQDWPISFAATPFTNGEQISLRACPHGWRHPAVEQLAYWSERGLDHLAKHLCCGCECAPENALPPGLRVLRATATADVDDATPMPAQDPFLEPTPEVKPDDDPEINISELRIPNVFTFFSNSVVRRSQVTEVANGERYSRARRERANLILKAFDDKQSPPQEMAPLPAYAAFGESKIDRDPNKVAENYLSSMKDRLPGYLHEALVLMASTHRMYGISRQTGKPWNWSVECEMDCSDFFNAGNIHTDDDSCVTLKLAILGGYVPEEWSAEDND